jgi:glutamate-1-semialdehyde 2,1-aminomutase
MRFDESRQLRERAHRVIPGGAHTYAKGDDQYPEDAPGFIARGQGCRVWDVDGNEFIEYGAGLRAVALGHGHPAVVEAAARAMRDGTNFVRPTRLEVELAEKLLSLLPAADMVKFAKNGSDATSAAVRLSRAYTGRDMVAICAEQPFFSVHDWFIGSTAMSAGIPDSVSSLTLKFSYNDLSSLERLFDEHPGKIACVVMEAATWMEPKPGFLQAVIDLCHARGTIFVLDEMITGFRWHLGGAQAYYGIRPDLSTFGKAIGNGFAVSALAGRRELMEPGGLRHSGRRVFLLSTTHGAETHALAAALATLRVFEQEDVVGQLRRTGEALRAGVARAAAEAGVAEHVQAIGHPANLVYTTRDRDGNPSQPFRTLFLQETIRRGLLMPSLVVNLAHREHEVQRTVDGIGEALRVYRRALDEGTERHLQGRPVKPVFREFA